MRSGGDHIAASWDRMWDLFDAARARPPGSRPAFLERACPDDEALRAEIVSLLEADGRGAAVLDDGPMSGGFAQDAEPAQVGERIGAYVIHEALGEGGFAVVYRAAQLAPVRREVALKIVKLGVDTRQVLARFRAEQQTLALMDHPGIARVLDAGVTRSGRPFFAMDLVRGGTPITRWCDQRRLTLRQRLELLIEVCHAVQHAHHKGVIHRDLKPSNILVTEGEGGSQVKVIDFGIARAVEPAPAGLTRAGQVVGTPQWMSPEQADPAGRGVDVRADIWALGAVLYELLAARPPRVADALAALGPSALKRALEDPPIRPSAAVRENLGTPAARDAAVCRRLAPTSLIRALRGDLDRIVGMALDPDRERRYESADALSRDLRRALDHQPVRAAPPGSLYRLGKLARRHRVAVAGAGAVALALIGGFIMLVAGLLVAGGERQRLQAALDEAERQRYSADAVTAFLPQDVLGAADPARGLGADATMREVLDRAAARAGHRFADQPLQEAAARVSIGVTYRSLGDYDRAYEQLAVALRLQEMTRGADDPVTLNARMPLAWVSWYRGEYERAERLWRRSLDLAERRLGPNHPDTLHALGGLAALYNYQRRHAEARTLHERAVRGSLAALGPDHPDTLTARNNLAWLDEQVGRLAEAERIHRDVLEIRRRVFGADHPDTLVSLTALARCRRGAAAPAEAATLLEEALATNRSVLGADHPTTLGTAVELAATYDQLNRPTDAAPLLHDALEQQRQSLGPHHRDIQRTLGALAIHHMTNGNPTAARPYVEELLRIHQALHGATHPLTRNTRRWLERCGAQQPVRGARVPQDHDPREPA